MSDENLSYSAYRRLRNDIVQNRIPAESVSAEHPGALRTPSRSALSRLETEGVIDRLINGVILVR